MQKDAATLVSILAPGRGADMAVPSRVATSSTGFVAFLAALEGRVTGDSAAPEPTVVEAERGEDNDAEESGKDAVTSEGEGVAVGPGEPLAAIMVKPVVAEAVVPGAASAEGQLTEEVATRFWADVPPTKGSDAASAPANVDQSGASGVVVGTSDGQSDWSERGRAGRPAGPPDSRPESHRAEVAQRATDAAIRTQRVILEEKPTQPEQQRAVDTRLTGSAPSRKSGESPATPVHAAAGDEQFNPAQTGQPDAEFAAQTRAHEGVNLRLVDRARREVTRPSPGDLGKAVVPSAGRPGVDATRDAPPAATSGTADRRGGPSAEHKLVELGADDGKAPQTLSLHPAKGADDSRANSGADGGAMRERATADSGGLAAQTTPSPAAAPMPGTAPTASQTPQMAAFLSFTDSKSTDDAPQPDRPPATGRHIAALAGGLMAPPELRAEVRLEGRGTRLHIRPDELGEVEITVEPGEDGPAIHVRAERPEIGEMMRRHADLLQRALSEDGIASPRLSFSQTGGGGGGGSGGEGGAFLRPPASGASPHGPTIDGAGDDAVVVPAGRIATSGRLDVRL